MNKTASTQTVKLQVELNFDDFLLYIDKFTIEQKKKIFDKLRFETFKSKFNKISTKIKSPEFSEEEILKEVQAVRKNKYATKK